MSRASSAQTLLSAVVATGAGTGVSTGKMTRFTAFIVAATVTTGGTVLIQSQAPDGSWATVNSNAISASGTTVVTFDGVHSSIRANLSARTDGTYTVYLQAAAN